MFIAIDKITNELILSMNVRDKNYKDTYNKELRFKCSGLCDNGDECGDENVVFVNSKLKQSHFRHSSASKCSAHKSYIEFNNNFYSTWFDLFDREYRKPYWFNCKLEQIRDDKDVIMIRYSQQNSTNIKCVEKYAQNKVIWILSLENRKYDNVDVYRGKMYIDFIGSKNDIPLYDNNTSEVYLDTGTDILLKVLLNNTSSLYGQEIECHYIYDVCKKYDHLFAAYPLRKKDTEFRKLIKKQKEYIRLKEIERKKYHEAHNEYIAHKTLKKFYTMVEIYDKLSRPKSVDFNIVYWEHAIKLMKNTKDMQQCFLRINEKQKEIKETNRHCGETVLREITALKTFYRTFFNIIDTMKQTYLDIGYIETIFKKNGYNIDLNSMIFTYEYHLELERNIIKNVHYDEYLCEVYNEYWCEVYNLLLYDCEVLRYLENQHREIKQKWIIEKKKVFEEKEREKKKKQEARKTNKLLKEKEKKEIEKNVIGKRLETYVQEYNLQDDELMPKLLNIINENYDKFITCVSKTNNNSEYIKDLKRYYTWVTRPINHNLDKMIQYIIQLEEYLHDNSLS